MRIRFSYAKASENNRGYSSVGLERLLDRQEVGSSSLPILTQKASCDIVGCFFFNASMLQSLNVLLITH